MMKRHLLFTPAMLTFIIFGIIGCLSSTEIDSTSDKHVQPTIDIASDKPAPPPIVESSEPHDNSSAPPLDVTPEYIVIGGDS